MATVMITKKEYSTTELKLWKEEDLPWIKKDTHKIHQQNSNTNQTTINMLSVCAQGHKYEFIALNTAAKWKEEECCRFCHSKGILCEMCVVVVFFL